MKLRLNLLTFFLADLFGTSQSRVSQINATWINFMHNVFSPLIRTPSRKQLSNHVPQSFKGKFPNTTTIIDCTDIIVEKPRTPTAQSLTYSSYKSRNTYKALVGITPNGAFSFISDLWGGNTSDRYITKECGFLDTIRAGDEVMADKGFTIRDLLLERRATLVIPHFTRKCSWGEGKRLTDNEIKATKTLQNIESMLKGQ